MKAVAARIRSLFELVRGTPLHPQWLLGTRAAPDMLCSIRGRVLDIGAGDRWLERALPSHVTYIAMDYPPTGRAMYNAAPDVFADGAALPFASESMDAIACMEVLEHVREPRAVLSEAARVLKRGGVLCISMPFLYPLHDLPYDFQRATPEGLRRDLRGAGFDILGIEPATGSIRTAGLMACLALAGGALVSGRKAWLLLPLAAAAVLIINVGAWAVSLVWPTWNGMASGYIATAVKK